MRLVFVFLFTSLSIFAIEPAQPKLTWTTLLELVDESTGAMRPLDVQNAFSAGIGSILIGAIATSATDRSARTAGGAAVVTGSAILGKVFFGRRFGDERDQEKNLRKSAVYKEIVNKIGETRAEELLADLRARVGLHRLIRDYAEPEESLPFLAAFRTEREKIAGWIPEGAFERDDRKLMLDVGAARRAVVRLASEKAPNEREREKLETLLAEDEQKIKEAMAKLPGATPARPIPAANGTH